MTRITKRGEDGQIVEAELTSEQASEMAKKRWANKDRSLQLLIDRGFDLDDLDEGARSLAEIAVSGRSGAVQAQKYLDQISGFYQTNTQPEKPCKQEVELIGDGSNFIVFRGKPYQQISGRAISEIVRMIKDENILDVEEE
jgi:hypothetical protein